jgi:prephenate dehydrogenase
VAAKEVEAGLVPIENVIQGPITSTLDLLLKHHKEIHISDSFMLQIDHALCSNKSLPKSLDNISKIFSHEQALQQCSNFIETELPKAEIIPVASTSAALDVVIASTERGCAAIAPPETALAKGLKILRQDISNVAGNKTRFVIIKSGPTDVSYEQSSESSTTSIVIQPGKDRKGLLFDILRVISVDFGLNLSSIHSRPDSMGGFVFHMTLEGGPGSKNIVDCIESLKNYCATETSETTKVLILGSYKQQPFATTPFKSVGIIGGHGRMGSFFSDFFTKAGVSVELYDQVGTASLEQVVQNCEIILLSLPMSATEKKLAEILPLLSNGQLLVENCSIKSSSLPFILKNIKPDVEVLGIHTLFGNTVSTIREEGIVITRTPLSKTKSLALEDLFYKHGARLIYSSAEQHDQTTAITQALTQLVLISLGETVALINQSPQNLIDFSTPNFRRVLESLMRTLEQSKNLISDLQILNTEANEIRNKFLEVVTRLVNSLNSGDDTEVLKSVEKAVKYFKAKSSN